MNIMVVDTETVSINKPFCYNIGYVIADIETGEILKKCEYIVEQIWHNLALFNTAYYAEKRPLYVSAMKGKKAKMDKFGYICQKMIKDIKEFDIIAAYAYNAPFDNKVFTFNCDWYKCSNPFDTIPFFDIRGYVHNFLIDDNFKAFCETNEQFTESGNYSTTAETLFRYVTNNLTFCEAHTALADSEIELEILMKCINCGAQINRDYKTKMSIPRTVEQTLEIVVDKKTTHCYKFVKKTNRNGKIYLTTK